MSTYYVPTAALIPTDNMSDLDGYTRVVRVEERNELWNKLQDARRAYAELKREVDDLERIDEGELEESLVRLCRLQAI